MLDRKAWIALTICGILLAVNMYFQSQNAKAEHEARLAKEKVAEQQEKNAKADTAPESENDEKEEVGQAVVDRAPEPTVPLIEKKLVTDEVEFHFSNQTGALLYADQLNQISVEDEQVKVRMNRYAEYGIGSLTNLKNEIIDPRYKLSQETTDDSISFIQKTEDGLTIKKTWSLAKDGVGADFRVKFEVTFQNNTGQTIDLGDYGIVSGTAAPLLEKEGIQYLNFFWEEDRDFDKETPAWFKGGWFSDEKSFYHKSKEKLGFAGVENQFFATIIDPDQTYDGVIRGYPKKVELTANRGGGRAEAINCVMSLAPEKLADGERQTLKFDIFMGPKRNALLRELGDGKGDVMDYGFFSPISRGLNWLLNKLSVLFGSQKGSPWAWGWAIVALTIIIRAAMWPLHAKSTRTMKRMSKLQPKMKKLKEKYPDDPNKMNQETMKLYREFGVNPMGGCLPMLAQIPIFFGFFTMLRSAVELRNEKFLGWVNDLSQPDTITTIDLPFSLPLLGNALPINLLPILMAVTMVLQMKLTPKTGDKMQQRIMMLMPLIFFFFCYNFASALALYWTTQNIFSIGQTWLMQKMPEPELKEKKKKAGKSFMEKLQEKAEEAQRMKKQGQSRSASAGQQTKKPKKPRGPKTGG